jgi:hypothetical protein
LIGIAVLPELAQHVVEISLGMFKSAEGSSPALMTPLRWAFAYPKVVGFALRSSPWPASGHLAQSGRL